MKTPTIKKTKKNCDEVKRRYGFLFILFLAGGTFKNCCAQYIQDVQLWTGVQLNKDLPRRFSVSAQYQLRFDNGVSQLKAMYAYASVDYDIIKKHLTAGFEYRYSTSVERDLHRFGFNLTGKYRYKKVTYSARATYQREHEYFNAVYERGHEPTDYLRIRAQVKWDFAKRWFGYVSCEPFIRFSNKLNDIDRLRSTIGIDWEFVKNHHLTAVYLFQFDINQRRPQMTHAPGINYSWDMPDFKKKKKKKDKQKNKSDDSYSILMPD